MRLSRWSHTKNDWGGDVSGDAEYMEPHTPPPKCIHVYYPPYLELRLYIPPALIECLSVVFRVHFIYAVPYLL